MHKTKFLGVGQCGAEYTITDKYNHSGYANTSDPTQNINVTAEVDGDDKTIDTSNRTKEALNVFKVKTHMGQTIAATARQLFGAPNPQYLNAIDITASQAIADTGATSIFIMEGTPCKNLCPAIRLLTINLPDGIKVMSTHTCDITIPGLPTVLVGQWYRNCQSRH